MNIKEKIQQLLCEPLDQFGRGHISSSFMSDAPDSQHSFERIEKPVASSVKPIPIGTGQSSKNKADLFKQSRASHISQNSQEDLITAVNPHKPIENPKTKDLDRSANKPKPSRIIPWSSKSQPKKITESSIDSVLKEIGLEKFPFWALEYLSIVYKQ
ncbi:unnamed protein product [Blepharisma stoltei]|uniref:Uncharacterized protein n=1 Tax=Blepharisma stoltei TaxID=1481888 RepID=A0AAU9KJI4_9CILI|nr:unnamed protein product [Blepharisma stoltei]